MTEAAILKAVSWLAVIVCLCLAAALAQAKQNPRGVYCSSYAAQIE